MYIKIVESLIPAFEYLESRITGTCQPIYSCVSTYELFRCVFLVVCIGMVLLSLLCSCWCLCACVNRVVQAFDPAKAKHIDLGMYLAAMKNVPALRSAIREDLLQRMAGELSKYQQAVADVDASVLDPTNAKQFSQGILTFWKDHSKDLSAWSEAARTVFAMKPSSAGAERIFSILTRCFGPSRARSLMDVVEGTLMVKFNSAMRSAEAR